MRVLLKLGIRWLALTLLSLTTPALADITPLSLSLESDNTITLSMHSNTYALHLDGPFSTHADTPFHVTGTVGGNLKNRFALTVHHWPDDVVGSIRLDEDWYQIESRLSAAANLGTLATDSDLVAIQPDVNIVGDRALGIMDEVLRHESLVTQRPLRLTGDSPTQKQTRTQQQPPIRSESTTQRALRVGIVVDSRFNEHHGGRGVARAVAVMNGVDAILQTELGLAMEVVRIVDYTDPASDPFRRLESSIDTLLMPALQAERTSNTQLGSDLALVHLFTGHQDQNTDTLVGLGWLNSVCNSSGFDVSLSSPFLFDTLLAAHEIMHNLGAPHDNSEQCALDAPPGNDFLMWSNISGRTTSRLSACSINHAMTALNAECAVDTIDMAIDIALTSQREPSTYTLILRVTNMDTLRTAFDVITRTTLPINSRIIGIPEICTVEADTLICEHRAVGASQRTQLRIPIGINDTNNNTNNTTSNAQSTRIRSEVVLHTNIDRQRNNNVSVLDIPLEGAVANNVVTVNTNASLADPAAGSDITPGPNESAESASSASASPAATQLATPTAAPTAAPTAFSSGSGPGADATFLRLGASSHHALLVLTLLVLMLWLTGRSVTAVHRIKRD